MVECLRCVLVMCVIGTAVAAEPNKLWSGFFSLVDNIMKNMNNLELIDGVTLVKTAEVTPRRMNGDFGMLLLDRFNSFVNSHAVRVDLTEPTDEGRGKKKKMMKKKDYLIPVLLAVKAKMAILAAIAGNTIGFIAAKAILVSKIALIMGTMLFLKKLITNPPKDVHHEHIKHRKIVLPSIEPEMHHETADWNKFKSDKVDEDSYASDLAYRKQKPFY